MAFSLLGLASTHASLDLKSLKVAASRAQAAPRATSATAAGARSGASAAPSTSSGMVCSCLQCQSTALAGASAGAVAAAAAARAGPVDYTDLIKKRGRISTDALLAGGNRWFHTEAASGAVPSAVARKEISFSFFDDVSETGATDANGFRALSAAQRDRVRDAFSYLSNVVDVSFTEVSGGGDIQYGSNAQSVSAGYARYPNEGSQVFMANNQAGFEGDWEAGSYTWQVLLHETAHALGLKHPGNYNAGGGGTRGPYLSRATDARGNTLMSYHNAPNTTRISYDNGQFSKSTVQAGTYQGYDIEALQYLYGASTTVQARSYNWADGDDFSNTLWNPNEGSQIDLSNQTGVNVVDLRAGKRSSIGIVDPYADMPFTKAQYAALTSGGKKLAAVLGKPTYSGTHNLLIAAGSRFTSAVGGSGRDSLVANTIGGQVDGGAGDDRLFWTGGNLAATGGEGTDTLLLKKVAGARWTVAADGSEATLTRTNKATQVVTTVATVTLSGIESVRYWNGTALKATGASLYGGAPATAPRAVA